MKGDNVGDAMLVKPHSARARVFTDQIHLSGASSPNDVQGNRDGPDISQQLGVTKHSVSGSAIKDKP